MKPLKLLWLALLMVAGSMYAAPPNYVELIWTAPMTSYKLTNAVGVVFTNNLTGYKVYSSPSLTTPWQLTHTFGLVTNITIPIVNGAQFYRMTTTWTTNGLSDTTFVSGESPFSNVVASMLPGGGDNLEIKGK